MLHTLIKMYIFEYYHYVYNICLLYSTWSIVLPQRFQTDSNLVLVWFCANL